MRLTVGVITGDRDVPDYRRAYGDSGKQCVIYLTVFLRLENLMISYLEALTSSLDPRIILNFCKDIKLLRTINVQINGCQPNARYV